MSPSNPKSVLGLRGLQSPVATKNTPRVRHAPVIGNATGFALSGWYCCTGTYDTTMAKLGDSWSKRSWILVSPLAIRWWRSSPQNHLRLIQKYPKIIQNHPESSSTGWEAHTTRTSKAVPQTPRHPTASAPARNSRSPSVHFVDPHGIDEVGVAKKKRPSGYD